MNQSKFLYILLALGVSLYGLNAQVQDSIDQNTTNNPALPSDEVTVLKDFQARLVESQRIKVLPSLPAFNTSKLDYFYDVNVRGLALDYPAPVIKPMAMTPDEKPEYYHSSIKLAYGYPRFSLAELHTHHTIKDKFQIGIDYVHLGARHDQRIPSRFNRHQGELTAAYLLNKQLSLDVKLFSQFDSRDILNNAFQIDATRRFWNNGMKIGISKPTDVNSQLDYTVFFQPYRLSMSDLGLNEVGSTLFAQANYAFGDIKSSVHMQFDRVANNQAEIDALSSFRLLPQLAYKSDYWNVEAGAQVLFENGQNYIFPDVRIWRSLRNSSLYVGLTADADIQANSFRNLQAFNPYLFSIDSLRNRKDTNLGLAVKGRDDRWEYHMEGGYTLLRDALEYRLIENTEGEDQLLWNASNTRGASPFVAVVGKYDLTDKIELSANARYQLLRDSNGNRISGYYTYNMGIGSKISLLSNSLKIEPGFDFYTGLESEDQLRNRSFYDLHVDIRYKLFKKLDLFVNADNILNNRNERWLGYSAIGIAVNGGVKIRL